MAVFSELLAPTKSEKHGAIAFDGSTLTITGKRAHCRYAVSEFAVDGGGRGFRLSKLDAGSDAGESGYSVLVHGGWSRCECRGYSAHGHCRHLAALEVLIQNDQI